MNDVKQRIGRGKSYSHYKYLLEELNDDGDVIITKRYVTAGDVLADYPKIKNRKQLQRIYNEPRLDKKHKNVRITQIKEPVFERTKINY